MKYIFTFIVVFFFISMPLATAQDWRSNPLNWRNNPPGRIFGLPSEQFNKYPYGIPSSPEKQWERREMERLYNGQQKLERRQRQMERDMKWNQLERERPGSWRHRPYINELWD